MFRSLLSLAFVFLLIGTSMAQETTSESDLREVIQSIQGNYIDYDDMEVALQVAVEEQQTAVSQMMNQLGDVRSVDFRETDQDSGVDVYVVRFDHGRTVWQFARSQRGRIAVLYFNVF